MTTTRYSFRLTAADLRGPAELAAAILRGVRGFDVLGVVAYVDPKTRTGYAVEVAELDGDAWRAALAGLDVGGVQGDLERYVYVVAATDDPRAQRYPLMVAGIVERDMTTADAMAVEGDRWTSTRCRTPRCCEYGTRWHAVDVAAHNARVAAALN